MVVRALNCESATSTSCCVLKHQPLSSSQVELKQLVLAAPPCQKAFPRLSLLLQGTLTHMAPEIMIKGHISKATDTYSLGMVLYELYTSKHVFKGIPRALLGHQITVMHKRPEFPANAPEEFVSTTQACWDPNPANRCVRISGVCRYTSGCCTKCSRRRAACLSAADMVVASLRAMHAVVPWA